MVTPAIGSELRATRDWLGGAFAVRSNAKQMKLNALDEPDLEALWREIGSGEGQVSVGLAGGVGTK